MRIFGRKIDLFLAIIMAVGIAVFVFKCTIAYDIKWLGDTDEAAYIEMADNLIHGKGLSNDYIQYSYFISRLKYPEITHPDAHYAPLYSLLIVPFFLILGKSAFAAKLPSIIIASIFLPILLYLLTEKLSKSKIAALAAGLSVTFFPFMFSRSLLPDDDVVFTFTVLASCFFAIKTQDSPKHFYPAGVFFGLMYYGKGTGLWLIPIFFLSFIILGGLKILRNKRLWLCFIIAFLVMLPWFIRNTVHFHNPIFSTQQYAAGYIGYKSWEEGTYSLYWNEDMPSLMSKLKDAGVKKVLQKSWGFYWEYFRWAFFNSIFMAYMGIPAIVGFLLFFLSWLSRGRIKFLASWYNRDFHALWLPGFFLIIFLSVCWEPIHRLALPLMVINIAIGWTTLNALVKRIFKNSQTIAYCAMIFLMLPPLFLSTVSVYSDYKNRDFPYGEDYQSWMESGKWIKENLPGSIIMFREPGQLHFYSEEKGVQVPLAELDEIIKVMKFYKVTHIIPHVSMRPAIKPLAEGKVPGLKLIYNGGLKIYEIQYDLLPRE